MCECFQTFTTLFNIVIYAHAKSVSRLDVTEEGVEGWPCFRRHLHKYRRDRNNLSIYTGDTVKADTPLVVLAPYDIAGNKGEKN